MTHLLLLLLPLCLLLLLLLYLRLLLLLLNLLLLLVLPTSVRGAALRHQRHRRRHSGCEMWGMAGRGQRMAHPGPLLVPGVFRLPCAHAGQRFANTQVTKP